MKSVLISINPKWCEKIANGEKTIEVRKTRPKIETPFKCYIYCTKASKKYQTICGCMVINTDELYRLPNGKIKHDWSGELMCCDGEYTRDNFLNGKVIGEFICDKVEKLEEHIEEGGIYYTLNSDFNEAAQLDNWQLHDYGKGKTLYGWHISNLKIYDKPKEMGEFKRWNRTEQNSPCAHTKQLYGDCKKCNACNLTRPPQSWCYVEEL